MNAQTLIVFGDGGQALFYEEKAPYSNRNGVKVQPILIFPTIEVKNKHGLTEEDLNIILDDGRKGIWMEYPVKQINWLSRSKNGAVILIFCSFDGSETPLMRFYQELLQWDEQRDQTESRLRAQISKLNRDLEDATVNQTEMMRNLRELEDVAINAETTAPQEESK